MRLFNIFNSKKSTFQTQNNERSANQEKQILEPAEDDNCSNCLKKIPYNLRYCGNINESISWKIIGETLYISGSGELTQDDYINIEAPAPAGGSCLTSSTRIYSHILPWSVCPCVRESKYISELCPVNKIPNFIKVKEIIACGEITGIDEFLACSSDYAGVPLQSKDSYTVTKG